MSIDKAIENIMEGKLDEMRENLASVLTVKAAAKLDERKVQIAENYFGIEQLDELSRGTLNSYLKKNNKKSRDEFSKKNFFGPDALPVGSKERMAAVKKSSNRRDGAAKARLRVRDKKMWVKPQKKSYGLTEE